MIKISLLTTNLKILCQQKFKQIKWLRYQTLRIFLKDVAIRSNFLNIQKNFLTRKFKSKFVIIKTYFYYLKRIQVLTSLKQKISKLESKKN